MEKKKRRKKERTLAKRYRSYLLEYRYNRVQEDYASSKECGVVGRVEKGEKIGETGLCRYRCRCHESPVMECAFLALRENVHRENWRRESEHV